MNTQMLKAADIHAKVGAAWPSILEQLGIGESYLRKKAGPCPACAGHDRYFFDNRHGRGDFHCRHCGAGDGFELLTRVFGWSFAEARRQVMHAAGLDNDSDAMPQQPAMPRRAQPTISRPPSRVIGIARSSCAIAESNEAMLYLDSRGLWPIPDCALRAHAGLDYWEDGQRIGRYPGLVAEVRDLNGELVTVHITYLEHGAKVRDREPRKILSKLEGREGCAVRLMSTTDTLAIAEGIETALSASVLLKIPAWAALNAPLLARFEPPPGVTRLVICADRDEAGLTAAARLMERLQGRIRVELQLPKAPANDFNDQLTRDDRENGAIHV